MDTNKQIKSDIEKDFPSFEYEIFSMAEGNEEDIRYIDKELLHKEPSLTDPKEDRTDE
ncbi:MAG: hypothetical protein K6G75_13325 [Lachnospiraceae bacterium]|nr:hypothetical protein [Lachnospiraceae bacterium]